MIWCMLVYVMLFVFVGLMFWVLNLVDCFQIQYLVSFEVLGSFLVAFKIVFGIMLFIVAFQIVWVLFVHSIFDDGEV